MVAFAQIVRKRHLPILVNVSGKTGFPAAFGVGGLAARSVFLKVESVFTHNCLFLISANCNRGHSLQSLVDYSYSFMEDLPDSYMTFS